MGSEHTDNSMKIALVKPALTADWSVKTARRVVICWASDEQIIPRELVVRYPVT
jgi:hypothetical protein